MAPSIGDELGAARRRLLDAGGQSFGREAALLLGHILGLSEAQLIARSRDPVPAPASRRFQRLLERRLSGEPVAYLLGRREFYGREFMVDDRVLVPRPETEHLVEAALGLSLPATARILDLGTGSGCLAVTLALELPGVRLFATDVSPAALAVARANASRHGVDDRVLLAAGDLDAPLALGGFDLVVSNPPYIDAATVGELPRDVRDFEPAGALLAGAGGTAILERLSTALGGLAPGTPVLLEIGADQSAAVARLTAPSPLELLDVSPDLAGRPRIARLRRR